MQRPRGGSGSNQFRVSRHAVLGEIEAAEFFVFADAQANEPIDRLEKNDGGDQSVSNGRGGADELRHEVYVVTVESVGDHGRPQAGSHAAQQSGGGVHRADVARVVNLKDAGDEA